MVTPWQQARFVALDFETTGLDARNDSVLSVGAVPIRGGRIRLGESFYRVANPGREVPGETVRIHGIRPIDLVEAPPVRAVMSDLLDLIATGPLVVWTAWVEASFLASSIGGSRRSWLRRLIDVRNLAARVDRLKGLTPSPAREETLTQSTSRMGLPVEAAHHALGDAIMTAQLFLACAHRLGPGLSAADLLRAGRRSPRGLG